MYHCRSFSPFKKWLLLPDSQFTDRTLKIGYCPKCHRTVIELKQIRKADNKIFVTIESGEKAEAIIEKLKLDKYHEFDRSKIDDKPCGWKFGVNIFLKNGTIKQYSSDWFGRKEEVKVLVNPL